MKAEIRARMLPIVLLVGAASAFSGVPIAMANRQVTPTNKTTCSGGLIEVRKSYIHASVFTAQHTQKSTPLSTPTYLIYTLRYLICICLGISLKIC